MRMSLIFLISFAALLSGCATEAPSRWDGLDTDTSAATTPLDCGGFPVPVEGGVYDKAGFNDLNDYRKCSEDNEAIATELAGEVDQLKISRKGLTEAGRAQENISAMKQEMLEDERKHNFYTSIGYWIVIIAMGVAL